MSIRRLVIDIGTNSVLALLADISDRQISVISDQKKTTRLGDGLETTGILAPDAIQRTADAVARFAGEAQFDELIMVGTEALRKANNSADFIHILKEKVGQEPVIVPGRIEAELSFLGSTRDFDISSENIIVLDVGGGSSEFVIARDGVISDSISIPIGALKLREAVKGTNSKKYVEKAIAIMEEPIKGLNIPSFISIIASGGTITSAVAIKKGMRRYDAGAVHGSILTAEEMLKISLMFEKANQDGRTRLIPFDPERAELMLPGLGIFLAILGLMDQESLKVSVGGVRFGAALYPDKILT